MNKIKNLIYSLLVMLLTVQGCKENPKMATPESEVHEPQDLNVKSSLDGLPIHYTVQGKGNHTLLLVHGWSCDQTYWRKQVPYFKGNYKVVTMDLGGHGKSGQDRTDWTIASFSSDVLDVINTLEYEKLSLVGHSLGVMVVIDATAKSNKPITTLVCVDYLIDPLTPAPDQVIKAVTEPIKADFKRTTTAFVQSMFLPSSDSTLVAEIAEDMSSAPPEIAIPAMIDLMARDYTSDFEALITRKVNRHIINSDALPTDEKHYDSLGFKIHTLPKTAHFLMIEQADNFNALLEEIIEGKK